MLSKENFPLAQEIPKWNALLYYNYLKQLKNHELECLLYISSY